MHVFVYEWITGGGLVEQPGPLPSTLLTEAVAILSAVTEDFAALEPARVTTLKDMRLDDIPLPGVDVVEVHSAVDRQEEFCRCASEADHTLIVAPEFDDILLDTLSSGREAGGNLLASSEEFVRLASNKHLTAGQLAEAGIPTPEAVLYSPDQTRLPDDFVYPAVLKPVAGAGSQHTMLISSSGDEPPGYPWPRRLETYCPGLPASVAFLCGPTDRLPLAPCRQHLSEDGRFTYLGGSLIAEPELADRATQLAERALDALPPARGYVGVDLILGKAGDGSQDTIIEVNPRMTTSYVGLRAASPNNLAEAMLDIFLGRPSTLNFPERSVEFACDGTIRHLAS